MKYRVAAAALTACVVAAASAARMDAANAQAVAPTLSFTAAQAASGQAEYRVACGDCHGPNLYDGEFGGAPLKGREFREKWSGQPAGALVGFIQAAMPPDAPGRLPFETYVEISAFLLSANGVPAGERQLPADMEALANLRIPEQVAAPPGR